MLRTLILHTLASHQQFRTLALRFCSCGYLRSRFDYPTSPINSYAPLFITSVLHSGFAFLLLYNKIAHFSSHSLRSQQRYCTVSPKTENLSFPVFYTASHTACAFFPPVGISARATIILRRYRTVSFAF